MFDLPPSKFKPSLQAVEEEHLRRQEVREAHIRTEMAGVAQRIHALLQWGITLLLTLESALFFVRKDASERAGLANGEQFPFGRHFVGTGFLFCLSVIIYGFITAVLDRYAYLQSQLYLSGPTSACGIAAPPIPVFRWIWRSGPKCFPTGRRRQILLALLLFPLSDLGIGILNRLLPLTSSKPRETYRVQVDPIKIEPVVIRPTGTPQRAAPSRMPPGVAPEAPRYP
jgi:hypothetical protein